MFILQGPRAIYIRKDALHDIIVSQILCICSPLVGGKNKLCMAILSIAVVQSLQYSRCFSMWSRTQVFGGVSVSFSLCSGLPSQHGPSWSWTQSCIGSCYPLVSVEAVLVYITCSNHKLTDPCNRWDTNELPILPTSG